MADRKRKDYAEAPAIDYGVEEPLITPEEKEYAGLIGEKRALEEARKPSYRFKEAIRKGFQPRRSFKRDVLGLRGYLQEAKRETRRIKGYVREAKKIKKEIAEELPFPIWFEEPKKRKKRKRSKR